MAQPKKPRRFAVDRTVEAFEAFQQRLMAVHAPEFTSLDLTMAQAKLLYVVTVAGTLTMSETAQRLGVTISTASGAVDHLVSVGLLSRVDDPTNRRQVRVSVAPAGIDTLEQMRELSARHLRALLSTIGSDDLELVERAIRILTEAVPAAAARTSRSNQS